MTRAAPRADAPASDDERTYDYIVVGAGSSGCVVAGELSADPTLEVLILECGDAAEAHPETLAADQYKKAFINDALMHDRFSTPQRPCRNHRLYLGSGRGVGGSGSVNAMVYTRGSAFDFSEWGEGWGWSDVVPAFERVEERLRIARRPPTEFTEVCIRAAVEAGFARKDDLNDGTLSGFLGYEWMNIDGNDRRSSYVAFLQPHRDRPNLLLETNAVAMRVLFDSTRRAVGVEYEREGRILVARARREVILSAGALETPKLLQLSGIGPAAALAALGIPLVYDQPAVGEGLMDHPNVQVFFRGAAPTDCHWAQLYGFHRANPDTSLSPGEADTCYVFYSARSSFREGAIRLLPGMLLPQPLYRIGWLRSSLRALIRAAFALPFVRRLVERMYGIVVILGKPQSRGTVRLRSRDPRDPALIDPGYFSAPEDLETLVRGVRLARRIAASPALAEWGNHELIPGVKVASQEKIEAFVRKSAMTTYHYAGTCRMGTGPGSVVDARLRVRGVSGLRIADASVIPSVPVSAMNAPSMMIGWRASQFLRSESERER